MDFIREFSDTFAGGTYPGVDRILGRNFRDLL